MDTDSTVIALLLIMIVASAIPVLANGTIWFACLLLIMVWTNAAIKKAH